MNRPSNSGASVRHVPTSSGGAVTDRWHPRQEITPQTSNNTRSFRISFLFRFEHGFSTVFFSSQQLEESFNRDRVELRSATLDDHPDYLLPRQPRAIGPLRSQRIVNIGNR